ncbi:ABC transporter ATP-binding protein [Streptococcus sp. 2022WUSS037]|uniref:ABC transporter ATP-binding protein n=1 Tax=Streptococcus sp. 2022WUSS037 TaxID=2983286 RepID=UPI0037B3E31E
MKVQKYIALGLLSISLIPSTSVLMQSNSVYANEIVTTTSTRSLLNTLEEKGYLEIDDSSKNVKLTEKYKQEVLSSVDLTQYHVEFTENSVTIVPHIQERAFTGVNKIVYTWKGFDVYLDSTNANRLAAGLGLGAVAAALVPDPTLSKALAIALGAAAGLVGWNNAAGRGIIIAFIGYLGDAKPHWIASQ